MEGGVHSYAIGERCSVTDGRLIVGVLVLWAPACLVVAAIKTDFVRASADSVAKTRKGTE